MLMREEDLKRTCKIGLHGMKKGTRYILVSFITIPHGLSGLNNRNLFFQLWQLGAQNQGAPPTWLGSGHRSLPVF